MGHNMGWQERRTRNKEAVHALIDKAWLMHKFQKYVRTNNLILKVYSLYLCSNDPDEGSEYLWSLTGTAKTFTMTNPTTIPSLVLLLAN